MDNTFLGNLATINHRTMVSMVKELDTMKAEELHNLISKTNVLRALISMALQDKKFPLAK